MEKENFMEKEDVGLCKTKNRSFLRMPVRSFAF